MGHLSPILKPRKLRHREAQVDLEVWLEWLLFLHSFGVGLHDLWVKVSKDPPCVRLEAETADSKP